MQAGKLRHTVTIQAKTFTQDPKTGEMVESWQDKCCTRASIEPLSVKDFIASGAEQSKVTARIVMRYKKVDSTMRILHSDTIYNIAGVLPDPKTGRQYITLAVSEGVNDG